MEAVEQGARARLSVDLGGLKAVLAARARATGKSPATLVREALAMALAPAPEATEHRDELTAIHAGRRVRVYLRMQPEEADGLVRAARLAGLAPARYVAVLVAGVPAAQADPSGGPGIGEHRKALLASSAQLASLARDLRQLTRLLAMGDVAGARVYRVSLEAAASAIQLHLQAAGEVLADLTPRSTSEGTERVARRSGHRLAGTHRRQGKASASGREPGRA
jgi:hypothetical protein